ncbi:MULTISPECIES: glycosyltransferase [unclassified Haladaptatus]|uniref:glycosyltransferase family 2 protein n=1 Tax=unclassified Haladaptatus TaxID=2622732 RepID=UPI00209C52CC|nr:MULTISPECIES: glycosyltransferase [unclassified Haladaptatus]MCO8246035.1 glycosyltransferase family 2 protein [Haladaptatus sp. AB643]MCO8254344.1 glycosyltransferase family 2 protein [Haladaptatus sp. AB618]
MGDPVLRPITAENPTVSVIIPTIPSNDHSNVIAHLESSEYSNFEIIVVEDKTISVCKARNVGLRRANGNIVAFTDDDCEPPSDWLKNIVAHFSDNETLVCLEGPVGGGLTYNGRQMYPTCNLAVRRDAALRVGGFREEFEYWREDTEFGWRLEEVGDFLFSENVRMRHPPQSRSTIVRSNEQRLKREYPRKYERVIVPDTIHGRVNDWLWRRGFWNAVDRVRYGWFA